MSTHPEYDNEETLLREIAAGSPGAFAVIYKAHFISLYHFVKRFVPDSQVAEDITTDTFIKLWERFSNFPNISAIKSFLFTTARNACLNQQRTDKREDSRHEEFSYLYSKDSPPEETITGSVYQYIYNEIEKLPGQTRKIFKMAFLEGMDNETIAKTLNLTNQSVRNYKFRALQLLRLKLSDKDFFILMVLACIK